MSESIESVRVELDQRSYDIEIGSGNLSSLGAFLAARQAASRAVVVTDQNVEPLHAATVTSSLKTAGITCDLVSITPGETSKSTEMIAELWQRTLDLGADRKTVIVALGGGVVGDLAGFLAASFARGISLLQIPTSLLAQVDSSVGGKVGINLPGAKNLVGAFWQPLGVLIDTEVLNTLPEREYRSGLAEVIKYGVILDAEFFEYLENNIAGLNDRNPEVMRHVVAHCCRLKADVVRQDEREETGLRVVLNYGHTFCHAFEAAMGYGELLHGEAVSIGMLCASRLAERLGRVSETLTSRQHDLLSSVGLPTEVPDLPTEQLLQLMSKDKKTEYGRLRFVLPARMGHVEVVEGVEPAEVEAAMTSL